MLVATLSKLYHRRRARSFLAPAALIEALLSGCASGHDGAETAQGAAQVAQPTETIATLCGGPPSANPMVLMDVGQTYSNDVLVRDGDRIAGAGGVLWTLWDAASGTRVASGPISGAPVGHRRPEVAYAGDTLLLPTTAGFALRDARDGTVRAQVALTHPYAERSGVASDGSYVFVVDGAGLHVWDRAGTLLFERPIADQRDLPRIYPAREALYLGGGGAVTRIAVPSGSASTLSAYTGAFHQWFVDGTHYITASSSAFHIYAITGALVRAHAREPVAAGEAFTVIAGGGGARYWIADSQTGVSLHELADGRELLRFRGTLAGGRGPAPHGAFRIGPTQLRLLHLEAGSDPSEDVNGPALEWPTASIDDASGQWAVANDDGLIFAPPRRGLPPNTLGCGAVRDIAGVRDTAAVATLDRKIRLFDLSNATPRLVRTLDALASRKIGFAAGGRYLVSQNDPSRNEADGATILVHDVERGERVHTFAELGRSSRGLDFAAATRAERIAIQQCASPSRIDSTCTVQLRSLRGDALWTTGAHPWPRGAERSFAISPDGTRIAVYELDGTNGAEVIHIYGDGGQRQRPLSDLTLLAWLEDEQLLVADTAGTRQVVGLDGTVLRTLDIRGFMRLSNEPATQLVFSSPHVFELTTGAIVYTVSERRAFGMRDPRGVALESAVIHGFNEQVFVERYR